MDNVVHAYNPSVSICNLSTLEVDKMIRNSKSLKKDEKEEHRGS